MKKKSTAAMIAVLACCPIHADDGPDHGDALPPPSETVHELETLTVTGLRERLEKAGVLKDVIEKTEVITRAKIEEKQAGSLAEAVDGEPGIRVSNECSMCGMKRVMINGMKGEHTTLLVDGVPMHSLVSSFYGMDAIATSGIERIEIARGSGASLTAPEAIGGTINIITRRATVNELVLDTSAGTDGYRKTGLAGTAVSEDGRTRVTVTAQSDDIEQYDGDGNGVNENPQMMNDSVTFKLSHDPDERNSIELRVATYRSDVFGGPTGISKDAALRSSANPATFPPAGMFAGGDVRKRFLGQPWETTEAIETGREEYTMHWTREVNETTNVSLTASTIEHTQDSFYEGFDYYNEADTDYLDFKRNRALNDEHLLTVGIDRRQQKMRSRSDCLEQLKLIDPTITGDSFDYEAMGLYVQDTWTPRENLEIALAVRYDKIKTDWIDQTAVGSEIDERLVSPRLHVRWTHNDRFASRFSAGRGYRAPLTFFESEHGILEDGFNVAVNKLEQSRSFGYALSCNTKRFTATASLARTLVRNLAFIDSDSFARPTLVNRAGTVSVNTMDIVAGYELSATLNARAGYEVFDYGPVYKGTFSVAPIETRASLSLDYKKGPWSASATVNRIGSRNLLDYGYGDRFNVFDDANGDGIADPGELRDPKTTRAPSFHTVDVRIARKISDTFRAYVGANNLFDHTQAGDGDSPLFWDDEGGYDVGHIYAPLRGRTIYLGMQAKF